ncbi:MAG: hypothetical protein LQ352_005914 [Teloschistes flavicans]|nr:MAG: hypothetical protein LQ352_005914 [Teloschistes flavicans]
MANTSNGNGEKLLHTSSPSDNSDFGSAKRDQPHEASASESKREDGKIEIKEAENLDKLGFGFPTWKKWTVLSVIFAVQVSMNFNTSVYPNVVIPLTKAFHISGQAARVGQMTFLVAYAFGSELWAPWSEDFGRWPILQLSLFLVNIWQIPCALAPNYGTIVVCRFLGGLSSAGGSVTLGMVADMWEADDQQYAVAFIVLSSVGGSSIGPVVGAFIQRYLSWHWNFWIQLIFGGAVQLMHFVLVPETRATIMLDREAKRRRKAGEANIWGPNELKESRISMKEVLRIWSRPFEMFVREPIVLSLSLLSGFSDALIFTFLESFQPVYEQWNFGIIAIGLAFLPINIGYILAWFSFFPFIHRHRQIRRRDPDALQPEARLYWLLWVAPLETLGLFGFAWSSLGPGRNVHWIAPMIFSALIAIANYSIYMATIDYMIASYGPYSASATGGNALARDFLAGIAAMYSTPFYENVPGPHTLEYPTTILACLAFVVTVPIYIFYWKGPIIREKSKFAQTLASDRKKNVGGGDVGEKAEAGEMEKGT